MAVKVVLDYLKKKLPPQVGVTIDGFLSGKGDVPTPQTCSADYWMPQRKPARRSKSNCIQTNDLLKERSLYLGTIRSSAPSKPLKKECI